MSLPGLECSEHCILAARLIKYESKRCTKNSSKERYSRGQFRDALCHCIRKLSFPVFFKRDFFLFHNLFSRRLENNYRKTLSCRYRQDGGYVPHVFSMTFALSVAQSSATIAQTFRLIRDNNSSIGTGIKAVAACSRVSQFRFSSAARRSELTITFTSRDCIVATLLNILDC